MDHSRDRFDSWKEIAEYLGRDRTTVMRWERTAGLPVRRVQGERGRSVFAYRADIDRWLAGQPALPDQPSVSIDAREPDPPRPPRRYAAGGAALALLVAVISIFLLWQRTRVSVVASVALEGSEIVASDASERELWRLALPRDRGTIVAARMLLADVEEDGRPEVIAALHFMNHGSQDDGSVLLVDGKGRIRWQRSLDETYRFGDAQYGPAWFPVDVVVYHQSGEPRISVAYHHHTWWPGLVVTYDAGGSPIAKFVNAGWITDLNVSADGRYLLAAGVSNSFGGAVLAVLDPVRPDGVSPGEGGSLPGCSNCPAGTPLSYFLAPWTELARPSDMPPVTTQVMPSGTIEWRAVQRAAEHGKVPEIIVTLSPALRVLDRSVNDFFAETQSRLARPGEPYAAAGSGPAVRQWTPETGWRGIADASRSAFRSR